MDLYFDSRFDDGLEYAAFLDKYAKTGDRNRWDAVHAQIDLNDRQRSLLGGFRREMQVLVLAGAWCGDCVNQCPIFEHFSTANDRIRIRFFDRDDAGDLAERLSICGGQRVPAVAFLSEDGCLCGVYGDRTLAKYRQLAANLDGAACPTGIGEEPTLLQAVVQEWLDEFERIQHMLRTSGRLRQLHGD